LADDVEVLDEIHDCRKLIHLIRRRDAGSPMLSEAEVGAVGAYIIQGSDTSVASYWVEPGIAMILELFKSPRSCRVAAQWLAQATGAVTVDPSIFEPLLRRGILVGAPRTSSIHDKAEA
jgi:hypothetical protein